MAISAAHYQLMRTLEPILPRGGTVLQIGEANWYGDAEPDFPVSDHHDLFSIARDFYAHLFAPSCIASIDLDGTPAAFKYDLNRPFKLDVRTKEVSADYFDLVINHGTAEHVFNIAQVFQSMHDHCKVGGLMIHESPFTGWIDHGFYCLQPTLYYDVAAANRYELVLVAITQLGSAKSIRLDSREQVYGLAKAGMLPPNAMLFVVYRKRDDGPFKVPMQGVYSRALSAAGQKAWRELR